MSSNIMEGERLFVWRSEKKLVFIIMPEHATEIPVEGIT
jgi:hypothetical protein